MAAWTVVRHPTSHREFAVVSDEGAWVEDINPTTRLRDVRPFPTSSQAWAHAQGLAREASPEGLERTVEIRMRKPRR